MQYNSYTAGSDVALDVTVPTLSDGVTITAIDYSLYDTEGNAVLTDVNVPVGTISNGSVTITIGAGSNALSVGETSAVRTVEVEFTDSDTVVHKGTAKYIIDTGSLITKLVNSFGTLNELILTLQNMPHITELSAVSEDDFSRFAVEAWRRLARLNFRYKIIDSNVDELSYLISRRDGFMYIDDIKEISQSEYDSFPQEFKTALMRAQVTEIVHVIEGNETEERRDLGIISETIGESKQFFNARPPLKFPVSRKSLKELEGFFYYKNTIARV